VSRPDPAGSPDFDALLVRHRDGLERWLRGEVGRLRLLDTPEDLAQETCLRALQSRETFELVSEPAFKAWLLTVAGGVVKDRQRHWMAAKRDAARVLRLALAGEGGSGSSAGPAPASPRTGPATFAERRDLIRRAVRALSSLPGRDQELVRGLAAGATVEDAARAHELTYAAAQRARLRALERFRLAWGVLGSGGSGGSTAI
jgi:RNA polymerase sigma factor (sigma-70 family)